MKLFTFMGYHESGEPILKKGIKELPSIIFSSEFPALSDEVEQIIVFPDFCPPHAEEYKRVRFIIDNFDDIPTMLLYLGKTR